MGAPLTEGHREQGLGAWSLGFCFVPSASLLGNSLPSHPVFLRVPSVVVAYFCINILSVPLY